jgi:hypothetical protein
MTTSALNKCTVQNRRCEGREMLDRNLQHLFTVELKNYMRCRNLQQRGAHLQVKFPTVAHSSPDQRVTVDSPTFGNISILSWSRLSSLQP